MERLWMLSEHEFIAGDCKEQVGNPPAAVWSLVRRIMYMKICMYKVCKLRRSRSRGAIVVSAI